MIKVYTMRSYMLLFSFLAFSACAGEAGSSIARLPSPARESIVDSLLTHPTSFGISYLINHTSDLGNTPGICAAAAGAALHSGLGYMFGHACRHENNMYVLLPLGHAIANIGFSSCMFQTQDSQWDEQYSRDHINNDVHALSQELYNMIRPEYHYSVATPDDAIYASASQYVYAYSALDRIEQKKDTLACEIQQLHAKQDRYTQEAVPQNATIADVQDLVNSAEHVKKELCDKQSRFQHVAQDIDRFTSLQQNSYECLKMMCVSDAPEEIAHFAKTYIRYCDKCALLKEVDHESASRMTYRMTPRVTALLYACKAVGFLCGMHQSA